MWHYWGYFRNNSLICFLLIYSIQLISDPNWPLSLGLQNLSHLFTYIANLWSPRYNSNRVVPRLSIGLSLSGSNLFSSLEYISLNWIGLRSLQDSIITSSAIAEIWKNLKSIRLKCDPVKRFIKKKYWI